MPNGRFDVNRMSTPGSIHWLLPLHTGHCPQDNDRLNPQPPPNITGEAGRAPEDHAPSQFAHIPEGFRAITQ
jgi:hypothetical protein